MIEDTVCPSSNVEVEDVEYRHSGDLRLLARIYRPSGPGPFPGVVSVHGGRWVSQSRLTNQALDSALARAGIVVMAIDFRMPPDVRYPEPISDINFAIRWLKQNATAIGSTPGSIGALGTSSGGHQMMLAVMKPHDPSYYSLDKAFTSHNAEVGFAVACWPVLDPVARYRMAKTKNMKIHVESHDAYWPSEEAMDEGSPQGLLERDEMSAMPRLLLIQGTGDEVVPAEMTRRFAASYKHRGGSVLLKEFAGQPHTFITSDPEKAEAKSALSEIVKFIKSHTDQNRS
jgi:acetyl esterase